MSTAQITVSPDQIEAFCTKWRVRELSLFGSVLRKDFHADSDVDVLISFQEQPGISLWDLSDMAEELEHLFGRKADLVIKEGLNNPFRRKEILEQREIVWTTATRDVPILIESLITLLPVSDEDK